jgi:hypothetical protein
MRKNSLTRQVRRAYSQDKLARICTLREDRFGRAFGMQTVKVKQPASSWRRSDRSEDYYHFRDNNASVLAVAHLDTVVRGDRRTPRFQGTQAGPLVTSGALDDRLGAYVILDLLPKLGIACDWLLTVGEESGQSTAGHFEPGKKYDWAIEFDRGGTDVVMYQYEDRASRRLVQASGATVGSGSYSDIAYLEQLGVKAFNWGVGYRGNYHSEAGYAYLRDTFAMVAKYLRFHEQNAGTAMPHEPQAPRSRSRSEYDAYDEYYRCDSCGERAVDSVTWYCTFCGICADCGATNADIAAEWNDPDVDVCQCYTPKHIRDEVARLDARDEATSAGSSCTSLAAWTAKQLAARDEAAEAGSSDIRVSAVTTGRMTSTPARQDSLKGLTWEQYLAQRPGSWSDDSGKTWHSTDEDSGQPELCDDCGKDLDACTCVLMAAYRDAQDKDGPGELAGSARRSPSIAPPWSEHRVSGSGWADGSLGAAAQHAIARGNWHEAVVRVNPELADIPGHLPGESWATTCLRCAARWPHKIADAGDSGRPEASPGPRLHAERDCPGCERCTEAIMPSGAIHVIPAHSPGAFAEDGTCSECSAMERVFPDADLAAGANLASEQLSASDR